MSQEAQSIEFNRGELLTFPWPVTASQYPNGSVFDWKLQLVEEDGDGVELEVMGSATVAGLSFDTDLTEANTLSLAVGEFPFTLWDTTNKRRLAFGTCYVGPAQE